MSGEDKNVLDTIDSSNIFDEFETGEIKEEFQAKKVEVKKNMYDYFSIAAGIFSTIFWLSIFVVGSVYGYTTIQNDTNKQNTALISPICNMFIGSIPKVNNTTGCPSISYLKGEYNKNLSELKTEQFNESLGVIEQIYKTENFLKSKEVIFLDSITKSKLRPLKILEAFDKLKYNYDTTLQERIKCSNFSITSDGILRASCEAFSSGYETNIKGFDGTDSDRVSGTSISVASSFLNYIEKESQDFILLNKQKTFDYQGVFDVYSYITMKTAFELELQYNNDHLINN